MAIADRLADTLAAISDSVTTRILILDCERLPGITRQYWWDRGDLKQRYIGYETVERLPRVTIVCAKWYDDDEVIRLAEWDKGGRRKFLRAVHSLMSQADVICGHNVDGADVPWLLNDLYVEGGLDPLPPFKTVDTLKIIRKVYKVGAPFKSLDAFCQIAGLEGKSDVYDRHAMERAVTERSTADRERLVEYCAGDVLASQALYDYLRPVIPNHPTLTVEGRDHLTVCHRCGHDTKPIPRRYIANLISYSMRRCPNCGGYSRISVEPERMSIVRSV